MLGIRTECSSNRKDADRQCGVEAAVSMEYGMQEKKVLFLFALNPHYTNIRDQPALEQSYWLLLWFAQSTETRPSKHHVLQ